MFKICKNNWPKSNEGVCYMHGIDKWVSYKITKIIRINPLLNLIKIQLLGLFLAKNFNFGLDPHISDANTDPFIRFGADLFVYLNHIGIQIT